jgi:hypothetical protein
VTNILTIGYDSVDLDKDLIRLGRLFIERKGHQGGFTIFSEDPRRDLDPTDPVHKRVWKHLQSVGIGAADALLLMKYMEKRTAEFKDQIAQAAMEALQR